MYIYGNAGAQRMGTQTHTVELAKQKRDRQDRQRDMEV